MANDSSIMDIELICVIVNFGLGSKLMQTSKSYGISGGTVLLAKGTLNNRILRLCGIYDAKKEVVLMVGNKDKAYQILDKLNEKFFFKKPYHGIAFTTSIGAVLGTRMCIADKLKEERGADNPMYHAITVIVDKGKAEEVIDAATKAGAKGGTIINGRGSGIHETSKLFNMDIEPEKEIVIILSKRETTENIVSSIRTELEIEKPGNGIIYIQDVNKTYGIYD